MIIGRDPDEPPRGNISDAVEEGEELLEPLTQDLTTVAAEEVNLEDKSRGVHVTLRSKLYDVQQLLGLALGALQTINDTRSNGKHPQGVG